ncbi:MAG: ROK family protein [Bacilli bacterium]|nr:ROK family protein [Bacilli bacterium]
MNCVFGLDVGGTNIKFGKFIDGTLSSFFEVHTELGDDPVSSILNIIKTNINSHLEEGESLSKIGVALPGPVMDGVLLGAENIKLGTIDFKKIMEESFPGVEIRVLNDANSATLGEWYYGSGNKKPNMVMVTLGTGLGAGIIINGKLYTGANGSAGEVGHIKVVSGHARPCTCGLFGCLEQYASATGIRKTAYIFRKGKDTILNKHGRISVRDIFDAAEQNDKVALDVIDKTSYYLAVGLSDIAVTINPDMIVLGGGVSRGGKILLDSVIKHFNNLAFPTIRDSKIVLASLFNQAGCYGAYYYVNSLEKK